MSIAVSVVIRPSPALRAAQAALCLVVVACGAWSAPGVAGALLVLAGIAAAFGQRRLVKLARIDISAVGQIRLTVYQQRDAQHAGMGQGVRLLPGSTLWPGLLLLRLMSESGEPGEPAEPGERDVAGHAGRAGLVHWLVVLPDSAAPDARRRLAVAARAIASGKAGGTKKNPANP